MGLFDTLKKKFSRPKLHHAFFGSIINQYDDVWECGEVDFKPLGCKVGVTIYSGPEGPRSGHIQFVESIAAQWSQLLAAIEPIARENIGPWIKDFDRKDIWDCLKLEGFDVHNSFSSDREWELGFWCEEADHSLMLWMRGLEPLGACVDG